MQIILIIIGILLGIGITFLSFYVNAQRIMFHENKSAFDFEETIEKFTASVASHEWKLLGQYDLQEKMRANGYEVIESTVFDICKPTHASQILKQDAERIVSPLLPCRVAIYKKSDGYTYVSRMNSSLIARPLKGVVPKVMKHAATDMELILASLTSKGESI